MTYQRRPLDQLRESRQAQNRARRNNVAAFTGQPVPEDPPPTDRSTSWGRAIDNTFIDTYSSQFDTMRWRTTANSFITPEILNRATTSANTTWVANATNPAVRLSDINSIGAHTHTVTATPYEYHDHQAELSQTQRYFNIWDRQNTIRVSDTDQDKDSSTFLTRAALKEMLMECLDIKITLDKNDSEVTASVEITFQGETILGDSDTIDLDD